MAQRGLVYGCVVGMAAALITGCSQAPGGFEATDFVRISKSGFNRLDNARDANDYAWSMAYFTPDGSTEGAVYAGTGNDVLGYIEGIVRNRDFAADPTLPPEIRRYRPEDGPRVWERVLDYRDVEAEGEFRTIGFRNLAAYRAKSDGVNYLYAATGSTSRAALWRSATGEPDSWTQVFESPTAGSLRGLVVHDGLLYLSFINEAPEAGDNLGKLFATDGATVWPVNEDGFGDANNFGFWSIATFNGFLYVGTDNPNEGYQVWKLDTNVDPPSASLIVSGGGPTPLNQIAMTMRGFKEHLYVGAAIRPGDNILLGRKAADIIRIAPDDSWETIVGEKSLSGFDSGFGHWPNAYIWQMAEHDGWFYASTYDQIANFEFVLNEIRLRIVGEDAPPPPPSIDLLDLIGVPGADLYKTQDGVTWYPVTQSGFFKFTNYGFRSMLSIGNEFFIGTANPFDGLEVWRARSG